MKHIVIDARKISSSTGTYVEKLIKNLEKIDHHNRYTVLVMSSEQNYYEPSNNNFSVVVADYPFFTLSEQFGLLRLLNQLKPDLVHFWLPQQPILYTGKKVTTVHDLTLLNTWNSDKKWLEYHIKQFVGKYVFWLIGRTNHSIITPTNYTKKAYLDFAKIDSSKVIQTYESADVSAGTTTPYNHPFSRYILYVGQQSDYKNIRKLGDAHQKILTNYPDLGLILVGKKNAATRANEQYFIDNNYQNIHFTDFIPDEQRDWLYQNAAAYVFPSLMEGFGLPGLEAMGYGAPVVSSNATCLPEVYGDAAHYFDPTDTNDIARAIKDVLSDEKLRKDLIEKGYDQIKKYSWKRMAKETLEIYNEALNGKSI